MRRMYGWLVVVAVIVAIGGVSLASAGDARARIRKSQDYDVVIDPADFVASIDNQYWPLVPGTTFVYEDEDGEEHNEVYVTYDTKVILGVTCTVVLDLVWEGGELVEETYDWYAQDVDGNVWYFGEDSREYEDGEVSTEGSWEAGVDGALPGIVMLADPQPGESYRQEYYEDEAEDMGKVLKLDASVSVPYGDYDSCLKTKEWTPLEPGVVEHKYYAPGVGLVLVEELKGGKTRIELIDIE